MVKGGGGMIVAAYTLGYGRLPVCTIIGTEPLCYMDWDDAS